jgi:hypothetical protein
MLEIGVLWPRSPRRLIKEGEFPDCQALFRCSRTAPPSNDLVEHSLANNFINVARLTGMAWVIYIFAMVAMYGAVLALLYHWARGLDLAEQLYRAISCRIAVAMVVAGSIVGSILQQGLGQISQKLAQDCERLVSSAVIMARKRRPAPRRSTPKAPKRKKKP